MTARRFSHAFRRLGTFLCLCSLLAQATLPVAHEWQTAAAEASYHHGDAAASGVALRIESSDSGSRHHHHDAASCRLCPNLSSFRELVVFQRYALQPPASRPAAAFDASSPRSSSLARGSASPRSPPQA